MPVLDLNKTTIGMTGMPADITFSIDTKKGEVTAEGKSATFAQNALISTKKGLAFAQGFALEIDAGRLFDVNIAAATAKGFSASIFDGQPTQLDAGLGKAESKGYQAIYFFNIADVVKQGSIVFLLTAGEVGVKLYRGYVRDISPQDRRVNITAITGDGILAERIIKEDYPNQDIGLTAKQIIDTYCSPLSSENVNINTGIISPIPAMHKKPISILEKMRRNYNVSFFVDDTWDLHFYLENEIIFGEYSVQLGEGEE